MDVGFRFLAFALTLAVIAEHGLRYRRLRADGDPEARGVLVTAVWAGLARGGLRFISR